MYGPKENGFWSNRVESASKPLVVGLEYEVTQPFVDFDGDSHPVGERWRFVGSSHLAYDDGLSLFVQTAEGEWHIRLQLRDEQQRKVWSAFEEYVRPVLEVD